jgi:two-component system sensor histidine kinase BarA
MQTMDINTPDQPQDCANNIQAIDWNLSLKLAANKADLAKDMLNGLVATLPAELANIQAAKNNHPELLKLVHKLHGAVCYCGLPRLKKSSQHWSPV